MLETQFHNLRLAPGQYRIQSARFRLGWGWIILLVGVVLPLAVLGIFLLIVGVVTGAIVMAAAVVAGSLLGGLYRLMHRPKTLDDGRRNVKIVVRDPEIRDVIDS